MGCHDHIPHPFQVPGSVLGQKILDVENETAFAFQVGCKRLKLINKGGKYNHISQVFRGIAIVIRLDDVDREKVFEGDAYFFHHLASGCLFDGALCFLHMPAWQINAPIKQRCDDAAIWRERNNRNTCYGIKRGYQVRF